MSTLVFSRYDFGGVGLPVNVPAPVAASDAANKSYVDASALRGIIGPATRAVVQAMTNEPRGAVAFLYDDLLMGLSDAGILAKLDWLFVPGIATDQQAALLDLKVPTRAFSLLGTTVPVFTANRGVQGDGASGYLELAAHANAGQFSLNSGSYGVVLNTLRPFANAKRALGWAAAQTSLAMDVFDGSGLFSGRMNDGGSGAAYPNSTSTQGFFAASRQASTGYNLYQGRSADTAPTQSTQTVASTIGPVAQNWQLLGTNSTGSEAAQMAAAWVGAGLSQTEINTLFTLLKTALTASGAWF